MTIRWFFRNLFFPNKKVSLSFPEPLDYAPTIDGHHTTYVLMFDSKSGKVIAAPDSNFARTTAEHQAAIRKVLRKEGLKLLRAA